MKNQQKRKKQENYFEQNIKRSGENFLSTKTTDQLIKDAPRIFKDIAFGNINYDTEGVYLLDNRLAMACYDKAYNEYSIANINYKGNWLLMQNGSNDVLLQSVINSNNNRAAVYAKIATSFYNFIKTNDINIIINLGALIAKEKWSI